MVAFHELRDGRVPHVAVVESPEQVVKDALPHGAGGQLHPRHLQLGEDSGHDGEAARQHRDAVGTQARELEPAHVTCLDQLGAELLQAKGGEAAVAPPAHQQDLTQRGAVPEEPTAASQWPAENSRVMVSSSRRCQLRLLQALLLILPPGKNLKLQLTLPMYRLSNWRGLNPLPMMNSVEPPPMSTTSRLSRVTGRLCATPR